MAAGLATVAIAVLALAAAGYLANRIGLPPVFGYLIAGIALSPSLGAAHIPTEGLSQAADIGILLLLFLIGAELDLDRLRKTIRSTSAVLPFDVLGPMVVGGGLARLMGWSFSEAIALGAAVALSSTLLGERLTAAGPGKVRERVLGVLVSEDVAAAGLLAFLAVMGSGQAASAEGGLSVALALGKLLFALVLLTAAALLVVPRILDEVARRHVHELLVLWGLAIVALWGYLGAWAGTAELGAFVAGVAAAEAGARFAVRNALQGIRDGAIALFFFASGLQTDIIPLAQTAWQPLALAGVFLVVKIGVHVPGALAAGASSKDALRTAFALGTLGEFSLIMVAVATRQGLAHPSLQPMVVGAMLILLPLAAILYQQADRFGRLFDRLPPGVTRPVRWLQRGLSGLSDQEPEPGQRRQSFRSLAANLMLLVAWASVAVAAARPVVDVLDDFDPTFVISGYWGVMLAVSLPLWRGAFRAYRDLVWLLVGLRPGERLGAGKVRVLLVDAMVAASAVLMLALVSLRVPATLPVLVAAAAVAAGIAVLAWRRLTTFHRTLEGSVARVLGEDAHSAPLLDSLLQRYPWGVRSAAVPVASGAPVARQTIGASRISELTGAIVAVVQRRGREIVNPDADQLILPGDTLILMGDAYQIARAEALLVAHGEAVRLTAQTRQATVSEVTLEEGSPWVGRTLADIDVRATTGTLVVGTWPAGARHPIPYEPTRPLRVDDRLLVIGTTLQIERVKETANP